MIRQLNQNDHLELMGLIKAESELNLFIIGDIENYGYNNDFQKLWGEFEQGGKLKAVMLKYFNSFIFYSRSDFFVEGFYSIMENEGFKILSGETSIIERFAGMHDFSKKKDFYFCKLDRTVSYNNNELLGRVSIVDPDRADEAMSGLVELYSTIKEFDNINPDEMRKKIVDRTGRVYYMSVDGKVVAAAQTTAENSLSAMVVAVSTHPEYRQKGYASACMAKLCGDLLNEGKSLCLFYNNPDAGRIYKSLGFEDIGKWSMYVR